MRKNKKQELNKIINLESLNKIELINNYLNKKFKKEIIGFASNLINCDQNSIRI